MADDKKEQGVSASPGQSPEGQEASAEAKASERGPSGKGNFLRAAVFLCIVALAVFVCTQVFGFADAEHSDRVLTQYYEQEPDTVDVVYFGSSAVQRGFVVPYAYEDTGLAAYSYTCGTQPFVLTRYFMEETLKTQSPKLLLVELRGVCKGPDDLAEVAVRRMLDNMKPSANRYRAIHYITRYAAQGDNQVDTTGLSYYFPLLKYHSRWNPSKQPKELHLDYYKGYGLDPDWSFTIRGIQPLDYHEKQTAIAPQTEEALQDLLDYCDGIDPEVLFVISPYEASQLGMEKLNYASRIIEGRGYQVLNCLPEEVREEMGLDDQTCYYNREHLNYYGSLKYTHFLSEYIQDRYGIADRRDEGTWDSWAQEYQRLEKNLDGKYAESYQKLMKKVHKIEKKQAAQGEDR